MAVEIKIHGEKRFKDKKTCGKKSIKNLRERERAKKNLQKRKARFIKMDDLGIQSSSHASSILGTHIAPKN